MPFVEVNAAATGMRRLLRQRDIMDVQAYQYRENENGLLAAQGKEVSGALINFYHAGPLVVSQTFDEVTSRWTKAEKEERYGAIQS